MKNKNFNKIVISLLLIVIAISVGLTVYNINKARNNNTGKVGNELYIKYDEEVREYEGIRTLTFTFYDSETNEPSDLKNGWIDLTTVIQAVNDKLSTPDFEVCELGVIGDKLYVIQDTTKVCESALKMNIISISNEITNSDWIEAIEKIYNDNDILAGTTITSYTDFGSKHYLYVYKPEA